MYDADIHVCVWEALLGVPLIITKLFIPNLPADILFHIYPYIQQWLPVVKRGF
jgi:hypothetical protein